MSKPYTCPRLLAASLAYQRCSATVATTATLRSVSGNFLTNLSTVRVASYVWNTSLRTSTHVTMLEMQCHDLLTVKHQSAVFQHHHFAILLLPQRTRSNTIPLPDAARTGRVRDPSAKMRRRMLHSSQHADTGVSRLSHRVG